VAADETKIAQIQLGVPQQKRQKTKYKKIRIQLKKLREDYNNVVYVILKTFKLPFLLQ